MFYSFREDLRYAYSVGKLKVWEKKLLTQHAFERLLSSASTEEIFIVLTEAGYVLPERAQKDYFDVEKFLTFNLKLLYEMVKKLSYHPDLIDLFIVRYDLKNLEIMLKGKLAGGSFEDKGIKIEETFVNLGLYGLDNLKEAFRKNNYELYPEKIREIFLSGIKEIDEKNTGNISHILEKKYYAVALEISSLNPFCYYLFKIFIDLSNLDKALRFKKLNKEEISSLESFFVEGGRINKSDFRDFLNNRLNLIDFLPQYSYEKILFAGDERDDGILTEKRLDDFLMEVLKESKFSFIGLESLVTFLLVKEMEIKNIRLVLQGKSAALTDKEQLPYLRSTYV